MVQIVIITIISAIIIVYLRSINSEFAILTSVCVGIIILSLILNYLADAFSIINTLIELSRIDKELYVILFKITAIGYIVEFGAGIVQDFGLTSLANKLVLAGKIVIFSVSLPILYAIINLITGLLQ